MKVKDLLEAIERYKEDYPDLLDWEIYTEQIYEEDKKYKKDNQKWEVVSDSEGWEYFQCAGFNTLFPNKKIFTINVNY